MVMDSDQPWPRVMRRLPVRGRRSVDRGRAGLAIELRNHLYSGCRPCDLVGKAKRYVALTRVAHRTRGVREPEHVRKLFARKPGDPRGMTGYHPELVRLGKARGRTPDMYTSGKSDGGIVSMKRTNKGEQSANRSDQPLAEFVEKRPPAEGNLVQTTVTGTQGLESASSGLDRVREAAKRDKDLRFHQFVASH